MTTPSCIIHFAHTESLEEAVALLRERSPEFARRGSAQITIGATKYPDFIIRKFALLVGPLDGDGKGHVIGIASAEDFSAKQAIKPDRRQMFAIDRLHKATVDELGNVALPDGEETRLYDVRLIKTSMPADVTPMEMEALVMAVQFLGKNPFFDARKYLRRMTNVADRRHRAAILLALRSFGPRLDYRKLPKLGRKLPPLKQLPDYANKRELYRSAFLKTGMRQPRHGKHALGASR